MERILLLIVINTLIVTIYSSALNVKIERQFSTSNDSEDYRCSNNCGGNSKLCQKSRFRTIDGSCNNLMNPTWGTPNKTYGRLIPICDIQDTSQIGYLPNAREISLKVFPDIPINNPKWTLLAMQYGQIVTHDMSLTSGVPQTNSDPVPCCVNGEVLESAKSNPRCAPILVPRNDPFNAPQGIGCIDFVRTISVNNQQCPSASHPTEPLTEVTSYIDLSLVYGNTIEEARSLREGRGGRLTFLIRNGQEWPPQDPNITLACTVASQHEPCYLTGDVRANQNPQMSMMQVILLRQHNRIANSLQNYNAHWNDEKLYQETRRILIAMIQHITYYEWLPIILGEDNLIKSKIMYPKTNGNYVNDYDPSVNPAILNEHATGSFRFLHSLIRGYLRLYLENRENVGSLRLSDWYLKPSVIEYGDNFSKLTRGLCTQSLSDADRYFSNEITQFLFREGNITGADLRAIDIQRGRDHLLPSYVDARVACGMPRAKTFEDLEDLIPEQYVNVLKNIYKKVEDVELSVAGALEEHHKTSEFLGPTFLCITTKQFYITRVADRYFFENGADSEIAFTPNQLKTIRETSMAALICGNVKGIGRIQRRAFRSISKTNPLVSCASIPKLNLALWMDIIST